NWHNATAPVAADALVFPSQPIRLSNNNDFPTSAFFHSITLTGSGYTLAGNKVTPTIGLTGSGTTGTNIVSLQVAGNGATVSKTAGSTLILSGANTYTGTTTVSAGVLGVANSTALGTTAAGTTVSSGATLQFQNAALGAETV